MVELTAKQREILTYIKTRQREAGFSPSVREIAEAVSLSSPSSVQHHINALIRHGFLNREPAKPRTLTFGADSGPQTNDPSPTSFSDAVRPVPIFGEVAAGFGTLAQQHNDGEELLLPVSFVGKGDDLFVLKVRGESMVDIGIFEGDDIIVRSQSTARNGDLVVAGVADGEEGTVKIFRSSSGRVFLEARNSQDPRFADPIPFNPANDKIYGVVVGLLRRYN